MWKRPESASAWNGIRAAVFHRNESGRTRLLEFQVFLDKTDPKAHFGSVLKKLEHIVQKQTYDQLPPHLKGHRTFLEGILAQLYAVKDAWRDKVSHVDFLVPTDTFTEEIAVGVHDAALLLMKKLADGLPANTTSP